MRMILVMVFICCCANASAFMTRLNQGKQDYDDMNLTSAQENFKAAAEEIAKLSDSSQRNRLLAEVMLYDAATTFFLGKTEEAKEKIALALQYDIDRFPPDFKMPASLHEHYLKIQLTKRQDIADQKFAQIINIPQQIAATNIEKAFSQQKQRSTLATTGTWLLASSVVPLGAGIIFGIGALKAKAEFIHAPSQLDPTLENARHSWRNQSLASDIGIGLGIALAATGFTLMMLNTNFE